MKILAILVLSVCLWLSVPAFCDEESDMPDYSYGEVVSATDTQLSVLEYDYEQDEENSVKYTIAPQTKLTNFAKISDLSKGDTVEIYFTISGKDRIAQSVVKDDMSNPAQDETPAP